MAKHSNCPESYEVFKEFIEKSIVANKSLIWSEENIWNLKNLNEIKNNYIDNPIQGGNFWDKLFDQIKNLNDNCWKIFGDAFFVYTLPSVSLKPKTKYSYIKKIADKKNFDIPGFNDDRWDVLNQGFVNTSFQYHQKYAQLSMLFLFVIRAKEKSDTKKFLNDHKKVRKELYNILNNREPSFRSYGMLNSILHLGYPKYYERIISNSGKEKIYKHYKDRIDSEKHKDTNIDEKIFDIRKSFEENEFKNKEQEFDFYLPSVHNSWNDINNNDETDEKSDKKNISKEESYIDDPFINKLIIKLRRNMQLIFHGPPGTGKTYYSIKLAKSILAQENYQKNYYDLNKREKNRIESSISAKSLKDGYDNFLKMCTFHPSYSYEEFIEGYRPEISEEGKAIFKLKDGIFKEISKVAFNNPNKTYVLIIDEINRGNIPSIFGELITLIEPEKRWQFDRKQGLKITLPASKEFFTVPENLYIIGTMNTADKSIALLDTALRRRFGFEEFMPRPELLSETVADINLEEFLKELNNRITKNIGRNMQVGHSYFMKNEKPINKKEQLVAIMQDKIIPLLQEYCYDDYTTFKKIIGSRYINSSKSNFINDLLSPQGQDLIIKTMLNMLNGAEEVD